MWSYHDCVPKGFDGHTRQGETETEIEWNMEDELYLCAMSSTEKRARHELIPNMRSRNTQRKLLQGNWFRERFGIQNRKALQSANCKPRNKEAGHSKVLVGKFPCRPHHAFWNLPSPKVRISNTLLRNYTPYAASCQIIFPILMRYKFWSRKIPENLWRRVTWALRTGENTWDSKDEAPPHNIF